MPQADRPLADDLQAGHQQTGYLQTGYLQTGARVRVRAMMPPGHVRTPAYLRGKQGVIERGLGLSPNPEALAYRQPAPKLPLLRVRFRMAELWGTAAETPTGTLDAEIYGHWLEPVEPGDAA